MPKKLTALFPWAKRETAQSTCLRLPVFSARSLFGLLQFPGRQPKDTPEQADFKKRFKTAPLGTWITAHGSEFVYDIWFFDAGFTGKIEQVNFLEAENCQISFEWKEVTAFTIGLRMISQNGEVFERAEEWEIIKYDFSCQLIKNQGLSTILCQVDESGSPYPTFWRHAGPLMPTELLQFSSENT